MILWLSMNEALIKNSKNIKPNDLVLDDLKWKYLVRSVLKAKNILLVGPTGCGKTTAAKSVAKALNRDNKFFYFNIGSTQDARSVLIGNTHFDKQSGTFFNKSAFINAIETPNAIILLDEISRGHHDAWNILMTVLDDHQRYVRLDESRETEIINVAKGVCFIATANIGNEYTSTRVMDRALMGRFPVKIEMKPLSLDSELELLSDRFNISINTQNHNLLKNFCEIAQHTRQQVVQDDSKITNFIPTRSMVEVAELIVDGFNLIEIAETVIYPEFSEDGGVDSERTYIKQLVQKYVKVEANSTAFNDPLKEKSEVPF